MCVGGGGGGGRGGGRKEQRQVPFFGGREAPKFIAVKPDPTDFLVDLPCLQVDEGDVGVDLNQLIKLNEDVDLITRAVGPRRIVRGHVDHFRDLARVNRDHLALPRQRRWRLSEREVGVGHRYAGVAQDAGLAEVGGEGVLHPVSGQGGVVVVVVVVAVVVGVGVAVVVVGGGGGDDSRPATGDGSGRAGGRRGGSVRYTHTDTHKRGEG